MLPTYNCLCIDLVKALHRQCEPLDIPFEILVADDGSPDRSFVEKNKAIEQLSHVQYILRNTSGLSSSMAISLSTIPTSSPAMQKPPL